MMLRGNLQTGVISCCLIFISWAVSCSHVLGFGQAAFLSSQQQQRTFSSGKHHMKPNGGDDDQPFHAMDRWFKQSAQAVAAVTLGLCISFSPTVGVNNNNNNNNNNLWMAHAATDVATSTTTVVSSSSSKQYDGFAEYAKENQMQQSDVGCFMNKCGDQTKNLFSNPRGIKGVSCLGRCKGEQSCATRCFAEFGSDDLNNWLSCTIEENECVKVPKNIDNSAENVGYTTALRNFDPKSLQGTWYKTDGLNPNYDLFDCQTNRFTTPNSDQARELDMDIFFRVNRPEGGFWENALTEHMVVDDPSNKKAKDAIDANDDDDASKLRTLHTSGKMYGLKFEENWYILGESNGNGDVPAFKLVAYKGHTLQGNYEGAFVYAKEPILPEAAKPAVREAANKAGLDFDKFTRIDNTCPPGEALNDAAAGTGTSTTDWIDLVVGEGGVIDWISPGWRGEYKQKS